MTDPMYKVFENTAFNDSFTLQTYRGAGQFGAVYIAQKKGSSTPVALKAIRNDKAPIDRIMQELSIALKLNHVSLLNCEEILFGNLSRPEVGLTIQCLGLVMEIADGNLEQQIGKLTHDQIREAAISIAQGLVYLHGQKRIHRDLKPDNIMRVGNTYKIGDFGMAKAIAESHIYNPYAAGAQAYRPPEGFLTNPIESPAWDIWSFGMMLWQLLIEDLPFKSYDNFIAAVNGNPKEPMPIPKLPAPFEVVVKGCLLKDYRTRWKAAQIVEFLSPKTQPEVKARIVMPAEPKKVEGARIVMPDYARVVIPTTPKELSLDCGKGIKLELVAIPAGSFMMGSKEEDDEKPIHQVKVPSFYMGKYAVMQAEYEAVMGKNISNFKGARLPVDLVSWEDAQEFCKKLNEKTGKQVRLPSEAEWEYACRAGMTTAFSFGDNITTDQVNYDGALIYGDNIITDQVNYYGNSSYKNGGEYRKKTIAVDALPANQWGLYQMHGNVWEWCEDVWHENYMEVGTIDGSAWLKTVIIVAI